MGRSSKAYVQCTRAINRAIKLEEAARKGTLAITEEQEESVVKPTKQLQVVKKKVEDRQFEDDFSSSDSDESTFQLQYELYYMCCEAAI